MENCIELKGMKFFAYHGVTAQERKVGNNYLVDILLTAPFEKAMQTDDLKDTVNYALVYDMIKSEMRIPSDLLEHVAGRIVRSLKKEFPQLTKIELKLSKLNPPVSGDIHSASFIIRQIY